MSHTPLRRMWAWPIALAIVTAVALGAALVTDDVWQDALWSAALALPIATAACRIARRNDTPR